MIDRMSSAKTGSGLRDAILVVATATLLAGAVSLCAARWDLPRPAAAAVAAGVAILTACAFGWRRGSIGGFVGSIRFAAAVFIVLVLTCITGTLVVQGASDAEYLRRYGPVPAGIVRALSMDDLFHSSWFIALLALLALGVAFATLRRIPFRLRDAGSILGHAGVLLILAGGMLWSLRGERGQIRLFRGKATGEYEGRDGGKIKLPFQIYLADFAVDWHDPRVFVLTDGREHPAAFDPQRTRAFDVPGNRYRIEVLEYLPGAFAVPEVKDLGGPKENPAIHVVIKTPAGDVQGWLFARTSNNTVQDSQQGFEVRYRWVESEEGISLSSTPVSKDAAPRFRLIVRTPAGEHEEEIPLGRETPVASLGATVLAVPGERFFEGDDTHGGVSPSKIPAHLTLRLGERKIEKWVRPTGQPEPVLRDDALGQVDAIYVAAPPEHVVTVYEGRSLAPTIVVSDGAAYRREAVERGKRYVFANGKVSLRISEAIGNAKLDRKIVPGPPNRRFRAVRVRVSGSGTLEETWLTSWRGEPETVAGGNLRLLYGNTGWDARQYRSVVKIADEGEVALDGVIEVNKPLSYKGYTFYQSTYDAKSLSWTGLTVVRNPGLPLVEVGLLLVLLGVSFVVYVRPRLRAPGPVHRTQEEPVKMRAEVEAPR